MSVAQDPLFAQMMLAARPGSRVSQEASDISATNRSSDEETRRSARSHRSHLGRRSTLQVRTLPLAVRVCSTN
jgi:hypothetical protein